MWPSNPCLSPWGPFREAKKTCPGERQVLGGRVGNVNIYL